MSAKVTPIRAVNEVTRDEFNRIKKQTVKQAVLFELLGQLRGYGLPAPEINKKHLAAPRRWEADLFWRDAALIVEYEGGIATHMREVDPQTGRLMMSRHATPEGFAGDCEKYNTYTALGYAVLRAEVTLVRSGIAARQIADAYFARLAQMEWQNAALFQRAINEIGARRMLQMLQGAAHGGDLA